jgi:zinc protease
MGASAGKLDMSMGLTTLTEHAPEAFRLMGLAATQPRVDEDALDRMKSSTLANIKQGDEDPSTVAWRLFRPAIFGNHPYARDNDGTAESVAGLTRDDVLAWHNRVFTRTNMGVVAVGDITSSTLVKLVDEAFGTLPEGTERFDMVEVPSATVPALIRKPMSLPQGTVLMGHLGLDRHDPDYPALTVMNEILGGGVLTSRLGADVREKHGLVYDVRTVNVPLPHNGVFYMSLATDNAKVSTALELVRKHLNAIRDTDVTDEELNDAKAYLVGSFPLRMDSNAKLLNMLSMMQSENMGVDYLETWPQRIAAVTKEDVRRVANRLIQPGAMALVVVGDGPALEAK